MHKELNYNIDDLLVKALLDEASIAEQIEINQWLSDSDDNQRYFEHFEMIWNQSKQLAAQSAVDEDAAWERFRKRTQKGREETPVIPLYEPKKSFGFLRVAALIAATLCTGWLAYVLFGQSTESEMLTVRSGSQTVIDTLPDGSIVTLNKKSSISYPAEFSGGKREVALTGEAFFEVTKDKTKPFIISVNDMTVKVLGTSFNVKDNARKTEVIVETGLVEVAKNNEFVRISPKQKATVIKASPALVKDETEDDFYKYYRTNKLVCNDTPLWRLVEILNETYDANIVIGNERLNNLPINTTFDKKSLDSTLSLISETLTIKVEHKGEQIILK
ncbi:FecR domain-containing protein [Dyadobacter sp. LJ53]|uniref:FecR family protein n=1 Tax=Dyadobacter chenwenxiniae TaxID=2906456 RepID=UPI001F43823F|nr:FecR domain-containing protein [Dyadobacter chenwenxiniae]MCF0053506.1 FecR domain-containing protein [Dyadobacter chenwenxiniae]